MTLISLWFYDSIYDAVIARDFTALNGRMGGERGTAGESKEIGIVRVTTLSFTSK
jgi:hypothetical protein